MIDHFGLVFIPKIQIFKYTTNFFVFFGVFLRYYLPKMQALVILMDFFLIIMFHLVLRYAH